MKLILPFEYLEITALGYYTNMASILSVDKEKMMPWVYNNFIQLIINRYDFNTDFLISFRGYQYIIIVRGLGKMESKEKQFKKWNQLTNFIIDMIDSVYYIELSIYQFYISKYDSYNDFHFIWD